MTDPWTVHESPLGPLTVVLSSSGALKAIRFPGAPQPPPSSKRSAPAVCAQLDEYFGGERTRFELELELEGTAFQVAVWERLRGIPYGSTAGYGEIADDLG